MTILRRPAGEPPSLSFSQERLWFLNQMEAVSAVYNIPIGLRLEGALNVPVLQRCLSEILRRHEALRTCFEVVEGQPRPVVEPVGCLEMPLFDLSARPEQERDAEARRLCMEEAQRPFDLQHDVMLRARLVRLGERAHILVLTMHHIASDGWSVELLVRELGTLYEAFVEGKPSPLPELPVQYADFAVWQREWLQGDVLKQQLSYWRKRLEGAPAVLELPTGRPRPATQSYRGALMLWELPNPLSVALTELTQREGATMFMTLLAGFQTLLHRYTGSDDILVGSTVAGRNRTEFEPLIGFFSNTLVLRGDLSGDPSFRTLLSRTREAALGAYAHQDLPFEKLVEELHPERDLSHSPFFQVMFVLQNAPREAAQLAGLEVTRMRIDSGTSKSDLTLNVREREGALQAVVEYNTDLFEAETIRRMLGHYQTLLEGIVANPEQRLSDLPLLTVKERHQLLVEWNQTQREYPRNKCVHELFEEQAGRTPEATAVIFEDKQLTYRQLNERANQLSRYLRGLGVGPDVLVGICVERSMEMVVGLLGILKAGGAYVPLDPKYPKERLAFMLEDARPLALVTQRKLQEVLPSHPAKVVYMEASDETDAEIGLRFGEERKSRSDSLAYVLYTSGSTGRPKGVAIEHRSAVAFATWARGVFTDEEFAGVLFSTSICFDLSVFELFVTLGNGGKVILAKNALELATLRAANEVRMINTVPSAIAELVRSGGLPQSVITVNLAGEPLAQSLVEKLYEHGSIRRVFDLYGPTETTTYSTFTLRKQGGKTTIGRPISNTNIYILDPHLRPVPVGIPGELYIAGDGVARGYLNRPELTQERFVPNPFMHGSRTRLYRTGDIARYAQDGTIEYLGRMDHQVKIRGFRVELGEIESALAGLPGVREAAVVARQDVPGDNRLVAYLTAKEGLPLKDSELRGLLRTKLPEYMVPSAFVSLDLFPLTPNGKVDRKALPLPDEMSLKANDSYVAPRTPTEEVLARIWCEILGLKHVGIADNFFELGGHSLLAVRVQVRVEKQFGIRLPLAAFFQAPTVADLAKLLDDPGALTGLSHALAPQIPGNKPPVVCLHSLGLSQRLAKHLGPSRLVYGVVSPLDEELRLWHETHRILISVEELAARYVTEIQRVQPRGPYNILGLCLGGVLGVEAANQLTRAGETVTSVILLDTFYEAARKPLLQRWTRRWAFHARKLSEQGVSYVLMKLRKKLQRRKQKSSERKAEETEMVRDAFSRVTVNAFDDQLMKNYKAKPYSGRVMLFRAVTELDPFRFDFSEANGWEEVLLGKLHVEEIQTDHMGIGLDPQVGEVARKLEAYLSDIEIALTFNAETLGRAFVASV